MASRKREGKERRGRERMSETKHLRMYEVFLVLMKPCWLIEGTV